VPKLEFRIEYQYKDERGILLPVALRYAGREADFFARVDTRASFGFFQRLPQAKPPAPPMQVACCQWWGRRFRLPRPLAADFFTASDRRLSGLWAPSRFGRARYRDAEDPAMPRDVLEQTGWLDRIWLGLVMHDRQLYLSHYDDPSDDEK